MGDVHSLNTAGKMGEEGQILKTPPRFKRKDISQGGRAETALLGGPGLVPDSDSCWMFPSGGGSGQPRGPCRHRGRASPSSHVATPTPLCSLNSFWWQERLPTKVFTLGQSPADRCLLPKTMFPRGPISVVKMMARGQV